MNYNLQFFIDRFEAIPENKWGQGCIHNKCAYYHCDKDFFYDGTIAKAFTSLAEWLNAKPYCYEIFLVNINDGRNEEYQQSTPKQRILAALYDIRSLQAAVKQAEDIINSPAQLTV